MNSAEGTVAVTVGKNNKVFINKEETPDGDLRSKRPTYSTRTKKEGVPQGRCRGPLRRGRQDYGRHQGAGIKRLGMVTDPAPK